MAPTVDGTPAAAAPTPLTVLFVTPSVEGTGGAERSLLAAAPHLAAAGIHLVVVVFAPYETQAEDLRAAGAEVIDVRGAGGRIAIARAVRRLIRERRPDLVHTMLYDADVLGRLAALGTGVPVLSTIAGVPPEATRTDPWRLRLARLIDALTARHAGDHIHAVTPGVAADAVLRLGVRSEQVTVVERGRDPEALGTTSPERRAGVRADLGLADDAQVVVAAGRHYAAKDHRTLVRAVAGLQADHPDLHLVLAGRLGPETPGIEAAVAAAPDPARIHVLGHRDDIADVVAAADVFASSSTTEGAAGAVIEALAIGVPVVTTDVKGLRGQLEHEVEVIKVPIGDPPALGAALVRVLDDADLRAGLVERGRARFERSFQLEANALRLAELSSDVAARRVAGRWGLPAVAGDAHAQAVAQTVDFYDQVAPLYTETVGGLMGVEDELFRRFVPEGASVLDIGVGAGRTSEALAARAGRYLGVDISPGMVEEAQRCFPDLEFQVGDAADLAGIADGAFDVVVFSYNGLDSLRPVEMRMASLAEIHRVLRPGGTFVFSCHNVRALGKPLGRARIERLGLARALVLTTYMAGRQAAKRLVTPAFWHGHGYETDVTHGIPMYGATHRHVDEQMRAAGFTQLVRLGGEFPHRPPAWCEQHWHFAYRSEPSGS